MRWLSVVHCKEPTTPSLPWIYDKLLILRKQWGSWPRPTECPTDDPDPGSSNLESRRHHY